MNARIKQLAISKGIYDSLCDPYDKHKTGDHYSSVMDDLERFAEIIVRECANVAAEHDALDIYEEIREHFGVEL